MNQMIKVALLIMGGFGTANAQVRCDRFALTSKLSGQTLKVNVDTDLPDSAKLAVSVTRSYLEVGNSERYPIEYFSVFETVGEWRKPRSIDVDNQKWRDELAKRRVALAAAGEGFQVKNIEKKVVVSAMLIGVQDDPKFGQGNALLTGKSVKKESSFGLNSVSEETTHFFPLK